MNAGKILSTVGIVAAAGAATYYLAVVQPQGRRAAVQQLLGEAMSAFAQQDCRNAAARFADARRRLRNDTLTNEQAEAEQTCDAFLGAPAGGIHRFLARAVDDLCAGAPLNVTDDLERQYGPDFFALIDSTAAGAAGDADVDPFIPDARRPERVADFRFALCASVIESREIERCTYSLMRGGAPVDVHLIRAEQRWLVRAVDVTSGRTVSRRPFWLRNPGSCEDNQALLNQGTSVVTGRPDSAAFSAWLEGLAP